jgi:hypothetical protein
MPWAFTGSRHSPSTGSKFPVHFRSESLRGCQFWGVKPIPVNPTQRPKARLATLGELRPTLLAAYLNPVPPVKTLRIWFKSAGIPRLKANPAAKRGGGPAYYSVAAIEKFLRSRSGLLGVADATHCGDVAAAPSPSTPHRSRRLNGGGL